MKMVAGVMMTVAAFQYSLDERSYVVSIRFVFVLFSLELVCSSGNFMRSPQPK